MAKPAPKHKEKTCLNPSCGKAFAPGHYGNAQLVCGTRECNKWYKSHWQKTRKRPRGIPDSDFERLATAAKLESLSKWALLIVACYSALRKGELLGLRWRDVLNGDSIKTSFPLSGQWSDRDQIVVPTKTQESRIGFLLQEARDALMELARLIKNPRVDDWIWPLSEASAWAWLTSLQKRLGINNPDTGRPYRFHDLRHTAAIRVMRTTGDLASVAELLGHSSLETSRIYTQERPEEFVDRLERAQKAAKTPPPGAADLLPEKIKESSKHKVDKQRRER